MAIAVSQTVTGAAAAASTITLTSWTPSASDLILLAVNTRLQVITHTSVSGNGLTWSKIAEINGGTNIRCSLWQALDIAPTAGSIVVTLSGAPTTALAVATRFSGADPVTPVEASNTATGTLATTSTVDITTLSNNAWAFAAMFDRNRTFTLGSGETAVSLNNETGTAGNVLNISTERQIAATPATITLDGTWDTAVDWAAIAVSIKEFVPSGRLPIMNVVVPSINFAMEV